MRATSPTPSADGSDRGSLPYELPASVRAVRPRLLGTLFAAQVGGSTGQSISLAIGSIVAADITGNNTWSGLPVGIAALGGALASYFLSRVMVRRGRRPGLALGYQLAVLGSCLGMAGAIDRSFSLLLLGMFLFGIGNASNLLTRFAAADVSLPAQRGRAIGLIVGGATLGAILGPNLLAVAARVAEGVGLPLSGSAFLVGVVGFGVAAILVDLLLRPDPLTVASQLHRSAPQGLPQGPAGFSLAASPVSQQGRTGRSVREVLKLPRVRIAVGALMTSQLVMIGTTSTAAVYLHDQGHGVEIIGLATAFHLGGMYATSPFAGWLCDRIGRLPVILLGSVLLIGAIVFAAITPGTAGVLVSTALLLNGVGWNFAFVGGSTLLTDALEPAERTSMQGMSDLATGLMGALGSTFGGIILQSWGFPILNGVGLVLVLGPLAVAWLGRSALSTRPLDVSEAAAPSA
jgi:MFS family permease